jgi:pyruvate ferredoxin oxidoreductase alpha subunit/phenylglyoxylate dehydrogenase alpha subunit
MAATVKAITGNTAAAVGAALCSPDVIAAYPITPQSACVEYLSGMAANGEITSDLVTVESEHAAMSLIQGAAAAGGRVFTATSAQGLALMFEPYLRMSTLRLPMVMAVATREMTSPESIWSGQQDIMSARDAGWIHIFAENNQEILDMIIQGYCLSENSDVLIPVTVCYDGFYLSHLTERVEIPDRADVSAFLPDYTPKHVIFDPAHPLALDPMTNGSILLQYRKEHLAAMQRSLNVLEDIDAAFSGHFGRKYNGAIELYRCDDADIVLLTIGAVTGTARVSIDKAREEGIKIGLIKVRYMRPFPVQKIAESLKGKKAWAVVDKSVCFGWNTGPLYMETRAAALQSNPGAAHFSVIGGLGGTDINLLDLSKVIERLIAVKDQTGGHETLWLEKTI